MNQSFQLKIIVGHFWKLSDLLKPFWYDITQNKILSRLYK